MRPAAMPAFSATSGVSLAVLVRPRMPSVPKYVRVMGKRSWEWSVLPQTDCRRLTSLSYGFQYLKPISQRPWGMGADIIGALRLGKEFGGQAGRAGFGGWSAG